MDEYANVWPQGGLFAFSGVDGETYHGEPFVASGMADGIGWRFWLGQGLALPAHVDGTRVVARPHPDDFCFPDCWRVHAAAGGHQGRVEGAFVNCHAMVVLLAFQGLPEGRFPDLDGAGEPGDGGEARVVKGEGWWVALVCDGPAATRRYGIAVSYQSAREASERAKAAYERDLVDVVRARMTFYEAVTPPESISGSVRRTFYKALGVHKVNIESAQKDIPCRWTTPDRMPHRHMWMWDTAFHAVGLQHVRVDLAEDAIQALFAKQRADGKLLLAAQPGSPPREEEDTQPPIVCWAVWRIFERTGHTEFLKTAYGKLVAYLAWFEANRKKDNGLYGWSVHADADPVRGARGGESGMDNSPRFDELAELTAVDLSSYMAAEYLYLEKIAKALDAEQDAEEWQGRREAITDRVNALLWDDEAQFYFDLDADGEFVAIKTTAGLMPLCGRIPDRDRAEALRMHVMNPREFWTPLPLPSVAADEDTFSKDMWRGPTWINANVLLYYGLMSYGFFQEARELAHRSIGEVAAHYMRHGCLYEYYDATGEQAPRELPRKGGVGKAGGTGFGVVPDLQWTAASFIHFVHEVS